jgi:hypothetical protein
MARQEWNIMKGTKEKIINNSLVTTRADKGRIVDVVKQEDYKTKILDFINSNDFVKINTDPTIQYHRTAKFLIAACVSERI